MFVNTMLMLHEKLNLLLDWGKFYTIAKGSYAFVTLLLGELKYKQFFKLDESKFNDKFMNFYGLK